MNEDIGKGGSYWRAAPETPRVLRERTGWSGDVNEQPAVSGTDEDVQDVVDEIAELLEDDDT